MDLTLVPQEPDDKTIRLQQAFDEFLNMRKAKKKSPTPYALSLLKKKLYKLSDNNIEAAIAILDQSTVNNWTDLYEVKRSKPTNFNDKRTSLERLRDELSTDLGSNPSIEF